MSADAVTLASVLAAVQADLRLPTQRDKRMTFRELPAFSKLSLRLVCVTDLPLGSGQIAAGNVLSLPGAWFAHCGDDE